MKTLEELGAAPSPWSVRDILPIGQGRDDATGKYRIFIDRFFKFI